MRPAHGAVVLLNWLGVGLTLPVLSLALLARGCTLQTLGVALGLYSAVAIAAELPSGILADLWGRRASFMLAAVFYLVGTLILIGLRGLWAIAAAMVLNGLGKAFSSGSLDALVIEQTVLRKGQSYLPRVLSQLAIFQCVGISAGSLLCGLLPASSDYLPQLAGKALLLLPTAVLTMLFVQEGTPPQENRRPLGEHLTLCRSLLGQRELRRLLLCVGAGCVALCGVEIYWQPTLATLSFSAPPQRLLSLLCAAGFGVTTLGSWWMGRIGSRNPNRCWQRYLLLLGLLGGSLLLLSIQRGVVGFAICYLAFYLLLGAANIPEQTILNQNTPDTARAAILSAYSFTGQLGGLGANLLGAALVGGLGVPGLWRVGAVCCLGVVLALRLRISK